MIGRVQVKEILDYALDQKAGCELECSLVLENSALTRFAGGQVHQNVAEESAALTVRAVAGKRSATVLATSFDRDSISGTVRAAIENARHSPEPASRAPLPGPQAYASVETYDPATGECSPSQRVANARAMIDAVEARGIEAYGSVETQAVETAVANTSGLYAYAPSSSCSAVVATIGQGAYGHAEAASRKMGDIDFAALGLEAAERCERARDAQSIPAGRYDVILLEYAVADIMQFLSSAGFGATAYREGRSFMTGMLGKKVLGDNITIWDDGLDPAGMPIPFDMEGMPKRRLDLVTGGVARGIAYDVAEGFKACAPSTGHAFPSGTFQPGPVPINVFLKPGLATLDAMIASTEAGLLVTRFHYTRAVDPKRVVITGMTRDGTFLVKNGGVACAVRNLRFTESYVDAMSRVEMISADTRVLGGRAGACVVPALKIGQFNFTGVTEF